jgi:hypothetical protein
MEKKKVGRKVKKKAILLRKSIFVCELHAGKRVRNFLFHALQADTDSFDPHESIGYEK